MASFTYFELHSPNLARAKFFYTELFGWKFDDLPVPGMQYSMIDGVGGAMQDGENAAWLNYIGVDSLDTSTERAQKLGAKVLVPRTEVKGMGHFTVISDPTGARLALWEELKK